MTNQEAHGPRTEGSFPPRRNHQLTVGNNLLDANEKPNIYKSAKQEAQRESFWDLEKIDFILHGNRGLEIYQDLGCAHIWSVLLGLCLWALLSCHWKAFPLMSEGHVGTASEITVSPSVFMLSPLPTILPRQLPAIISCQVSMTPLQTNILTLQTSVGIIELQSSKTLFLHYRIMLELLNRCKITMESSCRSLTQCSLMLTSSITIVKTKKLILTHYY